MGQRYVYHGFSAFWVLHVFSICLNQSWGRMHDFDDEDDDDDDDDGDDDDDDDET